MNQRVEPTGLVNRSVLVADDDGEMRRLIGESFRRAGFDVMEVADGRELVRRFRRVPPDQRETLLIVTDVEMPNMNGLQALQEIRNRMPDAQVIVVTGFSDKSVKTHAEELGAAAVFSKPVDLELLRDTALLLAGE